MSGHQNGLHLETENRPHALFAVALAFSVFQVVTATFLLISTQVLRTTHVGLLLLAVYINYPTFGIRRPWQPLAWLLGMVGLGVAAYQWILEIGLVQRFGGLIQADMVVGMVPIVLVFEAVRRMMGIALPIICVLLLAYGLFGEYLSGSLVHRGYGFDQIANQLSFGTGGLYDTPTYVPATYIYLFTLFGTSPEQAGMIRLFTDFVMGLFGHRVGRSTKVSVFSPALIGAITGSGVANAITTGQFTVPLMKRFGYKPAFAGGVEATASMGSQLIPPVMRAVAFVMAETISVPHVKIAKAALTPTLLHFGSVYWMVYPGARRADFRGLPREQYPSIWGAIRERWSLLTPLLVLTTLLFSGRTPLLSGAIGLALTTIVTLDSTITLWMSSLGLRIAFWVVLGLFCAGFFRLGIGVILVVIVVLVPACWFARDGRETLHICVYALAEGARHAIPADIVCTLVGVIIGVISLAGIAATFASYVLNLGWESLLLSLVLTTVTCLALGMDIPTIPNYIITSSIATPALLELGVSLIVSHMFVFYFGILANLTPSVAPVCFAAAPIIKERELKISFWVVCIALTGFVVLFMAVYSPAPMLQKDGWEAVLYVACKAVLAIGLWDMTSIGYLQEPLAWWGHLMTFTAGASPTLALSISDELGFVLGALVIGRHL